jgi:transglutaminase-like putative cysteine protease
VDDGQPLVTTFDGYGDMVVDGGTAWRQFTADGFPEIGTSMTFYTIVDQMHAVVPASLTAVGPMSRQFHDGTVVDGAAVRRVVGGQATTDVFCAAGTLLWRDQGMVVFERTRQLPAPFVPDPISVSSVFPVDVAVAEGDDFTSMRIEINVNESGDDLPVLLHSNRYQSVVSTPSGYTIDLRSQRPTQEMLEWPYPFDVPEEVAQYLRPTPMLQSADPILVEDAERVAMRHATAVEVVGAIRLRVQGQLSPNRRIDTPDASALQAYNERGGDCTEYANLFVALARAAGIPARRVDGMAYVVLPRMFSKGQGVFAFHSWAEVWIGEWLPIDPTMYGLGVSARYIQLGYNEPGHSDGYGKSGRLRSGGSAFTIDSYETRTGVSWHRE